MRVGLPFSGHYHIAFDVSPTKIHDMLFVCSLVKSFCSKSVSCVNELSHVFELLLHNFLPVKKTFSLVSPYKRL